MGETKYLSSSFLPSHHYGQGYEGHEGNAGNEEEGCEQDRKGQIRKVRRLPWNQGEDRRWLDQERLGGGQAWKDCEQEEFGTWQEGLRQHQRLDNCSPEGKEGTWREGLRRCQEGLSSLQEGQGVLQLNFSAWLQLRLWGYLHPSSVVASEYVSFVERC